MEELESILRPCATLDDFLGRPALREEYFRAQERYFGASRMNRRSYDEILRQAAELAERVPELKARLWETYDPSGRDFTIETWRAEGREVHREAWIAYLEQWRQRLLEECQGFFPMDQAETLPERDQWISSQLAEAGKKIHDFERRALGKKERQDFFKKLRASRELGAIASFFLYRHLSWETMVCQRLHDEDGDIILNQLRDLHEKPRDATIYLFRKIADPVLTHIKDRVPPVQEFLKREDLFPLREGEHGTTDPSAKSQRYRFESFPRRFHDIFTGIPTNDCLCGGLGDSWVPSISAVRWGVSLLEGAYTQHIRHDKRYLGSIRMTTVHRRDERSVEAAGWASLELHCPIFIKKVIARDDSGELRSGPLFMFWIHEALKRKQAFGPVGFEGFVLGEGNYFDNHRVLDVFRMSPNFMMGTPLGDAEQFEVRDPLARSIPRHAHRKGWALNFPQTMLFDATIEARNLIQVDDVMDEFRPPGANSFQDDFHGAQIPPVFPSSLCRSSASSVACGPQTLASGIKPAVLCRLELDLSSGGPRNYFDRLFCRVSYRAHRRRNGSATQAPLVVPESEREPWSPGIAEVFRAESRNSAGDQLSYLPGNELCH